MKWRIMHNVQIAGIEMTATLYIAAMIVENSSAKHVGAE